MVSDRVTNSSWFAQNFPILVLKVLYLRNPLSLRHTLMVGQPLSDFIILPEMVGLDWGWALGLERSSKIFPGHRWTSYLGVSLSSWLVWTWWGSKQLVGLPREGSLVESPLEFLGSESETDLFLLHFRFLNPLLARILSLIFQLLDP